MRDLGNTLIVVEHDEDTIRQADWIVDIGPYAGMNGGEVVVQGDLKTSWRSPAPLRASIFPGKSRSPYLKRAVPELDNS